MNKKHLFLMLAMATMLPLQQLQADPEIIDLGVNIYDPGNDDPGHRSPVTVPTVSLEDHTLYFDTPCDGCTLRLLDENDEVVYTTIIPAYCLSLVLPSYLSGEYELQIIQGNICYYATINL